MIEWQGRGSCPLRVGLLGALAVGWAAASSGAEGPQAAGRVTDLRGNAVAGALVQAESWESTKLGAARSDEQGRFQVLLSQSVKDLTLIVEHPGFQRWALSGTKPDKDGAHRIRLTRSIDREYLAELTAQSQPLRFRRLAQDLLAPSEGTAGDTLPLEQVLPFLKALRPWLHALLLAAPPLKDRDLPEEQRRAALLLAYLGDPRDDKLVDAWAATQNAIARPPKPCRGPTPDAAAQEWRRAHFEKEGHTTYSTLETQIAPNGDHGLALLTVRYANWGYSQYGVIVRLNGVWQVRRVIDNERWHKGY